MTGRKTASTVEKGKVNTWYVVGHKWNCPWCRRPIQFRHELRYHIWKKHVKKSQEWFEGPGVSGEGDSS